MVKDTIFWFIGSGLVVLFNVNKALRQEEFFITVFKDNIKLVLIILSVSGLSAHKKSQRDRDQQMCMNGGREQSRPLRLYMTSWDTPVRRDPDWHINA